MLRTCAPLLVCMLALIAACDDSNDSGHPPPPLLERYTLSSQDSVPEGVAFDPQERSFYATSLQGGGIVRVDATGREFIFREPDHLVRLVGTKVDAQRRRLWVCAQMEGGDNRVWMFGLASAEIEREFLLSSISSDASCNDLVVDSAGIAYVTDPVNPNVYKLDPALSGHGELLVTDPRLADITGAGLGLNGIALTPDEGALIVGKYVPASLFRISNTGDAVTPIALTGDTLPAPDGLAVLDSDLYAVSNGSVTRLRFNGDYTATEAVTVPQPQRGLSTATVAESQLYVIKSDVTNFVLNQPLDLPFEIFRVDRNAFDQ